MNKKIVIDKNLLFSIAFVFSIANFIIAIIAHFFMPNKIPAHFNAMGEIDRWGGSWEFLLLGISFAIITVVFTMIFYKASVKDNIVIIGAVSSICLPVTFVYIQSIFIKQIFKAIKNAVVINNNYDFWIAFVVAIIGCALLCFASFYPLIKIKLSKYMKNAYLGFTMLLVGIVICVTASVIKNIYSLILLAFSLIIIAVHIILIKRRKYE